MPFLTSRGLPIGAKGRLYSSSVHSVMLYGSEIGPVKKDAIRLKRNDPRMVKWMCKVRLEDRIFAEELRTRLKLKSMMESLHDRRLQWFGYLRKIRVFGPVNVQRSRLAVVPQRSTMENME